MWDEDNRISSISDNGQTSEYIYDASGDRTQKNAAQGETHYVNAYYVIREGQIASKHFFSGSQRVATKLAKKETLPNESVYEHEQYYYHSDHLGSSSFVTDETGTVYEHLEYFPFGETWIHEHSNTQRTPYRFTGKEYDEVTGLYYYGARYYDPRTSVWQSPDPIIDKYMPTGDKEKDKNLPGMGGIYNPKNLNMFGYTFNNPVNLVDPDGNVADKVIIGLAIVANVAMGVASLSSNISDGNIGAASLDALGIVIDGAAVAIPFVPGELLQVSKPLVRVLLILIKRLQPKHLSYNRM